MLRAMMGDDDAWTTRGVALAIVFANLLGGCNGESFSLSTRDGDASTDQADVAPAPDAPIDTRDATDPKKDAPLQNDAPLRDVGSDITDGAPTVIDARTKDVIDVDIPPIDARRSDTAPIDTFDVGPDAPAHDATIDVSSIDVADAGTTYRGTVLADGPLAYWRMGIATGSTVPDASGHQNDLLLKGGGHVLGVTGAIVGDGDTSIRFDGIGSYATALRPRDFDFPSNAPFTIECWARRDPLPDGGEGAYFQHLIGNSAGGPPNRNGFMLYLLPTPSAGTGYTAFEYDVPDGGQVGIQGPLAVDAKFGHYVATFDGTRASLYIDATLAASRLVTGSIERRDSDLAVGFEWSTGHYNFSGAIDEVAIYGQALSESQIAKHYAVGTRR
jgi:hypothetical protein